MPKLRKRPRHGMRSTATKSLNVAGKSWQLQTAKARFSEVFQLA
jgi:phage gp16-like protein